MAYSEREVLRQFREDMRRTNYCELSGPLHRELYASQRFRSSSSPWRLRCNIAYHLQVRGWLIKEIADIFGVSISTAVRMLKAGRWEKRHNA